MVASKQFAAIAGIASFFAVFLFIYTFVAMHNLHQVLDEKEKEKQHNTNQQKEELIFLQTKTMKIETGYGDEKDIHSTVKNLLREFGQSS